MLGFGELLGLEPEELLDEGDLGEVVVPHADTTAADVGVVAVIVGEAREFVERGFDVGGGEPTWRQPVEVSGERNSIWATQTRLRSSLRKSQLQAWSYEG